VGKIGLESCPVDGVGAPVSATDKAMFFQHLQVSAHRLGGNVEPLSQIDHFDMSSAACVFQDQPSAVVAGPGLHRPIPSLPSLASLHKGQRRTVAQQRRWLFPLGFQPAGTFSTKLRIARSLLDVQWNAPHFSDRLMPGFSLR
jgi:hypothetical protein